MNSKYAKQLIEIFSITWNSFNIIGMEIDITS